MVGDAVVQAPHAPVDEVQHDGAASPARRIAAIRGVDRNRDQLGIRGSVGPAPHACPTARFSTTRPWRRMQTCSAGC